ncbi:DUF2125 domain-containing protein [Alphaproteobacteria bacterium KMM 3653]|uniref:DUF2125 domain-containing protein n=1 Tax=Harenicola maris TaxID=2841044 RepID=A0AAP2G8U5_9RHOB|nr:DUF2125 domain-containing protein [Harenicola maris]
MNTLKTLTCSAAALAAFATAGWSLTAEEAWQNWQDQASSAGQTLTSTGTAKDGNTLTVQGLGFAMSDDEVTVSGTLGDAVFTENADGTVSITVPDSYDISFVVAPEFGEKVDATVNIMQQGLTMTASEAGGAQTFNFAAPSAVIEVTKLLIDGEELPMDLVVKLGAMTGSHSTSPTVPPEVTQLMNIASLDMNVAVTEPGGSGTFTGNLAMANLVSTSKGSASGMFNMEDMGTLLKDGFNTNGSLLYGASVFDMAFSDGTEEFMTNGSLNGGNITLALNKDQLTYNVNNNGMNISMSGSEIPLPEVAFGVGSTAYNFLMPLAQTNEPKPFVASVEISDLTVIDGIWNLFDPGAVLPRGPANLNFDLAGQANWLVDILDPASMAAVEMPAQIHAISLTDLLVDVVGTQLTGDGSFTFDNNDLATFGGFPAPNGQVNLKLVGANALLDKLVTMGLVPQDQANTAKLMSGMVLRPGEGEDTLVSEIAVRPTGEVTANGVPLPF